MINRKIPMCYEKVGNKQGDFRKSVEEVLYKRIVSKIHPKHFKVVRHTSLGCRF